ncbi:MAG: uL30 family ribosomal protein [Nanoarchaeota archaeon]|nr:uL30 family ribosomal protein [Nanoarchaeota archaeon]
MTEKQPPEEKTEKSGKIAAIRIRSGLKFNEKIKETMKYLNLHKKNWCVVLDNTPSNVGMLKKIKDFITWGDVSEEVVKELFEKRGEPFLSRETDEKKKITYNKFVEYDGKKYKRYFRLAPPKQGFGRKGIKKSFTVGGTLGYRAEDINGLIKKMI